MADLQVIIHNFFPKHTNFDFIIDRIPSSQIIKVWGLELGLGLEMIIVISTVFYCSKSPQ